jgi:UDP-N-acetylmuramate dehydrogenase
MMVAQRYDPPVAGGLLERLPAVRGRYAENVEMAPFTWFRVGGPAEVVFRPADLADLAAFLMAKPDDVPVSVIGVTSNLLVRDGGIAGVVVRLGKEFAAIDFSAGKVRVGASMLDANVALAARRAGRGGLEFLSGIPGSIGGGLRMNAGAYGREFKDLLIETEAVDPLGRVHRLTVDEMAMGYRCCGVAKDWIFVSGLFVAEPGDAADIERRTAEIRAAREASQPIGARTGGSTFTNPLANPEAAKSWDLIDAAGCRGLRLGGAMVSELHCNFLINTGTATAAELEALGEEVHRRVLETSGVDLRWEIRRIGMPTEQQEAIR